LHFHQDEYDRALEPILEAITRVIHTVDVSKSQCSEMIHGLGGWIKEAPAFVAPMEMQERAGQCSESVEQSWHCTNTDRSVVRVPTTSSRGEEPPQLSLATSHAE